MQRFIGCQCEWSTTELGRSNAKKQVVHDRIADNCGAYDLVGFDLGIPCNLCNEFIDTFANSRGQILCAVRVHLHVRNTAHEILAKSDLRVHDSARRNHLPASKIA